ncbi:MAG: OmpA family protein [Candidatus Kapaibacteriota bacterium]
MKKYFVFTIIIVLFSCATKNISVERISDLIELEPGDSAVVFWSFKNADYVMVGGYTEKFKPIDSIIIKPDRPLRLDIIAFKNDGNQLLQSVYVLVNPNENQNQKVETKVQTGPRLIEKIFEQKNFKPSSFHSGFATGFLKDISKVKVFRLNQQKDKDSLELIFGVLDDYGNMVYDIGKHSSDFKIRIEQKCQKRVIGSTYEHFPKNINIKEKLNVYFLIDYAVIQDDLELRQQILDAVKFLDVEDKVALFCFGVGLQNIIPLERVNKFYYDFQTTNLPVRNELSSVYRSIWFILDEIEARSNSVLVLITNRMDNSSMNITLEDAIEKSQKINIPINVIVLGNEVSPSTYRYLAYKTNGNFYHFPWKNQEVGSGILECILSNKYYFSIVFEKSKQFLECNDVDIKFTLQSNQLEFFDLITYPVEERTFYTNYQAVSLFNFADTSIDEGFIVCLNNLAQLLKGHRNLQVELIGTAGIGEQYYSPIKLSLDRANAVRSRLIASGVSPNQILVKGIGISKPIYTDENDDISSLFNRRVEIRWIMPELLPFTIVVDTVLSEELAEKKVEFWERQGFKAYYDRLYLYNSLQYKIVLWGYAHIEEAKKDAKKILRRYKKSFVIE